MSLKIGKDKYGENYTEVFISDGGYGCDNNTVTFDIKDLDKVIEKLKKLKEVER
ncbi:hypothetical protein Goe4_c00130 [Bacillus phage vB_BthP-Goe4]|uniref:Uncharacterized protein n=1 Tax=Bacillus phage vB_BthP-Goe4 TaxID=2315470 RepID=A0A386KQQ1_9CAUD|nr:hypothetical protein H3015_gp31 [Bacillus phage vB_BthP-Goe4]AYD87722.1 hypothetical protein Goe4_c00130 [Bacillus phage vB_BthP-Goe4]